MKSIYKRHRFPPSIIQYAVWLYYRFNLSTRDVEDLLAERNISVSYEAIRLWINKFGPEFTRLRLAMVVLVLLHVPTTPALCSPIQPE